MLEETPPGQHPTKIKPSAMASGRCKILVRQRAISGMIRYWAAAPMQISNGRLARILKSLVVSVNPILNIIIPMMTDCVVNLFVAKSVKSEKLTQLIRFGIKKVMTAMAITTMDV